MSKDYCIKYNVKYKGKKHKYNNEKFISVLKCIDTAYKEEQEDKCFSINRAKKIICHYCDSHFKVMISQREIESICYPQKGYFTARAGIILMAMYNLLKSDSEQNDYARRYILHYFEQIYSENVQSVLEFYFGGLPDQISQCIQDAKDTYDKTLYLWNAYSMTEQRIINRLDNKSWMYYVRHEFPAERFNEDNAYKFDTNGRVYLCRKHAVSLY